MSLIVPTLTWLGNTADTTPDFDIGAGEPGDVIDGDIFHIRHDGVDYLSHTVSVAELVDGAVTVSGTPLPGGVYQFSVRLERGSDVGSYSADTQVTIAGGGSSHFTPEALADFHDHHDRLKEVERRRSKNRRQKQDDLREAVEAVYDNLAGIAPAVAAKVAEAVPAKAKITETAARSAFTEPEVPAIDWSKVTSDQISKVIATMDAYASQLAAEQRQQDLARADARRRDEADIETMLMGIL